MISETERLPKLRRYGIPYKGSKNGIAEWVYKHFPKQTNFYDLFAGGCAITQIALMKQDFKNYFCNDIDPDGINLFLDAVNGKFKNETRWISREDFLNSNEPYVKICWSFGNNLKDYLYSKEIEPWKKALHYARVYKDFSLFEEMGIKLKTASSSELRKNEKVIREKYVTWYVKKYFNSDKSIEQLKAILTDKNSLESLRSLQRLQSLERLSVSNKSYDEVEIIPNSVLYCDIPYYNTNEYVAGGFDHQKFYKWALRQKEIVVISEYYMPDDFLCIDAIEKSVTLCSGGDVKALEKLFIPRKQAELYKKLLNKKR